MLLDYWGGEMILNRLLKIVSVVTSILLLWVLLGGALVTKTDSGAGCGSDWPLCHGKIIPSQLSIQTIIELTHRASVGLAGMFVTLLSVLSWFAFKNNRDIRFFAVISFLFLVLQALFGAAAVIWGQSSFVLALHFGISLISFASVILLTLLLFEVDKKFDAAALVLNKQMKFHIYGIACYILFVIYSGALVRHAHASLSCSTFPLCQDGFHLPVHLNEWIQIAHRTAAFTLFVWIAIATFHAIKHYARQRVMYWGFLLAFCLVSLQAITGILSVITNLYLVITLSHALCISCLFSLMCYFVLLAKRSKKHAVATSYVTKKIKGLF